MKSGLADTTAKPAATATDGTPDATRDTMPGAALASMRDVLSGLLDAAAAGTAAAPAAPTAPIAPAALDHETRLHADDHEALRLWLRLLTCTNLIDAAIRLRLRADFNVTLPRFDLLAQLYRHPEGLKMGELSQRLMVTGGNVTGIAGQLEQEGLVTRLPHPGDRRSFVLSLTGAGRRSFARMAAQHEQWVVELLGGISAGERDALHGLLARLKTSVRAAAVQEAA